MSEPIELDGFIKYDPFGEDYFVTADVDYDSELAHVCFDNHYHKVPVKVLVILGGEE